MAGLHEGGRVLVAGEELGQARGAVVLVHGRGGSAEDMLALAREWQTAGLALLAPQAMGNTWYPYSFLAPIAQNEPALSSALATVDAVLARVVAAGIPAERTVLIGFSQGACLALEYAARNARRYGGLVGLSGGLIGPEGAPRDYPGALAGTPVFLGCSDIDAHIPKARVLESATVLRALGGAVEARLYPGMGHTVNQDEIAFVQGILDELRSEKAKPLR
jgi:phospholipase/carboxylesterase